MCVGWIVKPWHEWMFVFFAKGPDAPNPERSDGEWRVLVGDAIGDSNVNVEVVSVSKWLINETSADVISKGNVWVLDFSFRTRMRPVHILKRWSCDIKKVLPWRCDSQTPAYKGSWIQYLYPRCLQSLLETQLSTERRCFSRPSFDL